MALYESVFIARQDITAAQVEGLVETFEKVIMDAGGSVPKKESWGLRTLAYKIKKNRKGHYVYMTMEAPAAALGELERTLHFNEDVLRFMSIKIDALDPEASPMMRNKSSREDRSIRRDGEREPDAEEASEAPKVEAPKAEAEASTGETAKEGDN